MKNHVELTIGELEEHAHRCEVRAAHYRGMVRMLQDMASEGETLRRGDSETLRNDKFFSTQRRRDAKTQGEGNGKEGTLKAVLLSVAEGMPGSFKASELAKAAKHVYQVKQVADFCSNMARAGTFHRVGHGVFSLRLRGPGASARAPGVKLFGKGSVAALCPKVAGLAEPFRTDDVMEAAGVDRKRASNWVTQAGLRGWISRVSQGQYKRTKSFGKEGEDSSPLPSSARPAARSASRATTIPEPGEREKAYRELRGEMKIHVPRIGEGMREEGDSD
jgi:hypothetical protein